MNMPELPTLVPFFFLSYAQNTRVTKVLNFAFPSRSNIWRADRETFFHSAITPDLFEIFLEGFAMAACLRLPTHRPDLRLTRRP